MRSLSGSAKFSENRLEIGKSSEEVNFYLDRALFGKLKRELGEENSGKLKTALENPEYLSALDYAREKVCPFDYSLSGNEEIKLYFGVAADSKKPLYITLAKNGISASAGGKNYSAEYPNGFDFGMSHSFAIRMSADRAVVFLDGAAVLKFTYSPLLPMFSIKTDGLTAVLENVLFYLTESGADTEPKAAFENGDVNTDDFTDIRDLVRLKKILAVTAEKNTQADVNGDSLTDANDLTVLKKSLLNGGMGLAGNPKAFHDQSAEYMSDIQPAIDEDVDLKIRVLKNTVTSAIIEYSVDGIVWKTTNMKFEGNDASGEYQYYTGTVPAQKSGFYYRFKAFNDITNEATSVSNKTYTSDMSLKDGWYCMAGQKTPDWSKGALWYSLVPDAFYNGDRIDTKSASGRAATLVQMTYIGSPSVYYGQETCLNRSSDGSLGQSGHAGTSFYAMDWNEQNIDREMLDFYKTLGELRKNYESLKTGAAEFIDCSNSSDLLAFARYNKDETVITLAARNNEINDYEIETARFGVKNGEYFTDYFSGEIYPVQNGKIKVNIPAGGATASNGILKLESCAVSRSAPADDWSAETAVISGSGGIKTFSEDGNYIALTLGERLTLSVNLGGNETVVAEAAISGGVNRLQLARVGTEYTAYYSDGENKYILGKPIFFNPSAVKIALFTEAFAEFDYFLFGNGSSVCTPFVFSAENISVSADGTEPAYEIKSGDWEYSNEGIAVLSASKALMSVTNKVFTNFRVNVILAEESDAARAGLVFGMNTADNTGGGYQLYKKQGSLILKKNDKTLKRGTASDDRLAISLKDKLLNVYCGTEAKLIFSITLDDYAGGYVGFFSEQGTITFANYAIYALPDGWRTLKGTTDFNSNGLKLTSYEAYASASYVGYALADGSIGLSLKSVKRDSESANYCGGLVLGAAFGKSPDTGIFIGTENGAAVVKCKGTVLYSCSSANDAMQIAVSSYGGHFSVSFDTENSFEFDAPDCSGGCLSVYGENSVTSFYNIEYK